MLVHSHKHACVHKPILVESLAEVLNLELGKCIPKHIIYMYGADIAWPAMTILASIQE